MLYFEGLTNKTVERTGKYMLHKTVKRNTEPTPTVESTKDGMKTVIQLAQDPDEFINMRANEDKSYFKYFVEYFLVHFTLSRTWKTSVTMKTISQIFTPSDEAFCMLIIENNAEDLQKVSTTANALDRTECKPLYTKNYSDIIDRYQGWSKDGIKRFNTLFQRVVELRSTDRSKDLEEEIMLEYLNYVGPMRNVRIAYRINDDEEDTENEDYEDAIDGFLEEQPTAI